MQRKTFRWIPWCALLAAGLVAAGLLIGGGWSSVGASAAAPALEEFQFHQDGILGTSLDLTVVCREASQADAALAAVLDEIERLRRILSTYDSSSEISRLAAAAGPVRGSPELLDVLGACEVWRVRSDGAFNAQLGDLVALWTDAAKAGRLPDEQALAEAVRRAAQPLWQIDAAAGTVARIGPGRANVSALAKGYIIEKAAQAAMTRDPALTGLLLAIGGDLRVMGSAVEGPDSPWLIGVVDPKHCQENAPPLTRLRLADRAVATSGHYERYSTIEGKRYSHILDPRTGRPVEGVAGATAVAPDAATADALSTTLCVLAPEDGLRLAASVRGAECLIVGEDGRTYASAGWAALEAPAPAADPAPATAPAGQAWPAGSTVNIAVEMIAKGKRPYVVFWIEDAAGKPVRLLSVWGSDRKYFKELPAWWALYRNQADLVKAVTRATRTAGKYQLAWDGLDDAGKPVGSGKYTVRVETAQEEGPHLLLAGTIACEKDPATTEIAGNRHIKDVTVTFGPPPAPAAKP
jgi:FAD:protein FMN transferase